MDREPNESTPNGEFEAKDPASEPLLESLGLELTPELVEIISALKIALANPDVHPNLRRQLWHEYWLQFEASAEYAESQASYDQIQIGAMLHKALIFRDTANEFRYLEELDKADMYATNNGMPTLSTVIATEINSQIMKLEQSAERLILQLRGKLSDSNREYLWELWAEKQDYEVLINRAYEMLVEEDENPREVFRELGVSER